MPGQISHQGGKLAVIGDAVAELPDIIRRAVKKTGFNGAISEPEQRLIVLVRHVIDPRPQAFTAWLGEGRLQAAAVLGLDHVPARSAELLFPLGNPHPDRKSTRLNSSHLV